MYQQNNYSGGEYSLDLFFELSLDLLCIAGFDGYFKHVNPAFSNLLGYSNDELRSRPVNEFIYIKDRDITSSYRENIKKGIPLVNFENRYITKKGELIWLAWTSIPLTEKKIVYAIAKNVTHRKKLEEDRNTILKNLSKSNNELKHISYTTSHDLRSPVNSLLAIINMLNELNIQDKETLKWVNLAKCSTDNLIITLNNQLQLLKENKFLRIKIEIVNLNKCLGAVIRMIPALIKDSNTKIEYDFSDLEAIKFNKPFLQSILLNLITNSIKYARPDFYPYITIRSRKCNGASQLIYSDNGLGFDMDKVKDKIFGFNQTFHNHKDSQGIGLYLIYNHVTNLGGRISVESKPNEGATFTITFKE
ncbi:hypothetical protein BH23BAC1_BH23BAC1_25180 [soil metagenome]